MTVTPLPLPPTTSDPENFSERADEFLEALPTMVTEFNADLVQFADDVEAANIAFDQKLAGAGFTGESVTSNNIGTGSKTWTLEPGLDFVPGAFISAADAAAPTTNYLTGQVTSYDFSTGVLVALIDKAFGSGTKTSWVFSVVGRPGSAATVADVAGLEAALLAVKPIEQIVVALSDEATAITTGNAKVTMRMPYAFTLTAVRASLNTASSSGIPTIDINESGTTILSTKLTIDVSEKTSTTAAAPVVISDASLADDAEITFDIDVAGTGAKGLKVALIGRRT